MVDYYYDYQHEILIKLKIRFLCVEIFLNIIGSEKIFRKTNFSILEQYLHQWYFVY